MGVGCITLSSISTFLICTLIVLRHGRTLRACVACVRHCSARYCMSCQSGVCVSCCEYHVYTAVCSVTLEYKAANVQIYCSVFSCFSKRISACLCLAVCVMGGSEVCSPALAGFRLNNVSLVGSRARRLGRGRKERERERHSLAVTPNPPHTFTQCPPSAAELIESETPPLIDSPSSKRSSHTN